MVIVALVATWIARPVRAPGKARCGVGLWRELSANARSQRRLRSWLTDRFCLVRTRQAERGRTREEIPIGPVADHATQRCPALCRWTLLKWQRTSIIGALASLSGYRRKGSKDFRLHQAINPKPPYAPTAPAAPLLGKTETSIILRSVGEPHRRAAFRSSCVWYEVYRTGTV